MVNLKALLTQILGCCYTTGTDGIWTYKKYGDGTYEATGSYQASNMTIKTASAGTYYGGSADIQLPSFSQSCVFAAGTENPSQASGVYIYQIKRTATTLNMEFRAHASTTGGVCGVTLFVKGTWK